MTSHASRRYHGALRWHLQSISKMFRRLWLPVTSAVVWLCLIDPSLPARAQGYLDNPDYGVPRGPLPIRDARPFNLIFLQFIPESGDTLKTGKDRFDVELDLINNLLIPDPSLGATVIEQNEYQRLRVGWRHGIGRHTEIGVFVPLVWRDGGIMDGLITFYHHLVGLPDNAQDVPLGRDHYPQYQSHLEWIDSNGRVLVSQGNAFGLGETVVTVKHGLLKQDGRSALAVRFGVKIPTGNPTLILGSGSLDVGATFDGRYSLGRDVSLYGNLGYVVLGRAIKVPGSRANTVETLIGIEFRANNRDSYLLQVDGNGQFVHTGNRFADGSNVTVTFGVTRVLDRRLVGFASFSEAGHIHNFTVPGLSNIGPGFTVTTGLTWLP